MYIWLDFWGCVLNYLQPDTGKTEEQNSLTCQSIPEGFSQPRIPTW